MVVCAVPSTYEFDHIQCEAAVLKDGVFQCEMSCECDFFAVLAWLNEILVDRTLSSRVAW